MPPRGVSFQESEMPSTQRLGLLATVVLFAALTFVVPTVRLRLATGEWGIAMFDRRADPFERLLNLWIVLCGAAMLSWVLAYTFVDPVYLSVFRLPASM